jgi:outer membrane protein OmpA-like peptidoglycan-associated protein
MIAISTRAFTTLFVAITAVSLWGGGRPDAATEAYVDLAKTLIQQGEYEEAAIALEHYVEANPDADRARYEKIAEILRAGDDSVEVRNIGPAINTNVSEIFPRVTADGKYLFFVARNRKGGYGGEDAWIAERREDGTWSEAQNVGDRFNTKLHEGVLSISHDNNLMLVFGNYMGHFGAGDIFYSVRRGSIWSLPCNIGGAINTPYWESMANLAPNGRTVLFASNRPNGEGGEDIWVSTLTTLGWSEPKNLGPTVNTKLDEKYPFLAGDGETLYFSSDGHPGLGGQDIFVSRKIGDGWDEWSEPENLGPSINTTEDDQDISLPISGDIGYLVRINHPDGYGGADIYEFDIPESMRPKKILRVSGRVYDERKMPMHAIINYYDLETGKEIAKTASNYQYGDYGASLPYGKDYLVKIDMLNYLLLEDTLYASEGASLYQRRDYVLQKIRVGLRFELRHIYFDFGDSTLKTESAEELDKLYEILDRTSIVIELGGHTDDVGSAEANLALSQARVNSVKDYMVRKGISPSRVNAVGYGEAEPIASNETEEGRARNRRVEVKVTSVVEEEGDGGEVYKRDAQSLEIEAAQYDMLALLRWAAIRGGLPEDSPCKHSSYFFMYEPFIDETTIIDPYYAGLDPMTAEMNIVNEFAVYARNWQFEEFSPSFGAGARFVDEDFHEYYGEFYFAQPEEIDWSSRAGYSRMYLLHEWLNIRAAATYGVEATAYKPTTPGAEAQYWGSISIGARYLNEVEEIEGLKLGFDLTAKIGVYESDYLEASGKRVTHGILSLNARKDWFEARFFFVNGGVFNHVGLQLGVGF